jgi:hypothetical protein
MTARAAGVLAGRVGCPVDEGHAFLRRQAAQQHRTPAAVAGDVLATLHRRPGNARAFDAEVEQELRRTQGSLGRRARRPHRRESETRPARGSGRRSPKPQWSPVPTGATATKLRSGNSRSLMVRGSSHSAAATIGNNSTKPNTPPPYRIMNALYLSGRITAICRSTSGISSAAAVWPSMSANPYSACFAADFWRSGSASAPNSARSMHGS